MFHSNRIIVSQRSAKDFFVSALHPDPEMLRRRDIFFNWLDETTHVIHDGNSLVMEIPDIDFDTEDLHGAASIRDSFTRYLAEHPVLVRSPARSILRDDDAGSITLWNGRKLMEG